MKQKKYKLTKETMCFDGVTLQRRLTQTTYASREEAGEMPTHPQ